MSNLSGLTILFLGMIALLLLMVLYGLFTMFMRLRKMSTNEEDRSNVGFVVDTFHTLMTQLKEKEAELQHLRTQAEERAGIMEDHNENILQSVPSGVVSLDTEWRIVKVNAAAKRILQLRENDLLGSDGRQMLKDFFDGSDEKRDRLIYRTRAGRRLWLDYSITPLVDSHGREIGHLLVFTDMTELRTLESQSALRERLSSLGEMAAGIAHELRNPMGVITGYMRLLKKKVDPSQQDTVDAVTREVGDMERIISDFLSFARPGEPNFADITIRSLVEDCARGALAGRDNIETNINIPESLFTRADETQLRQVFTNLIQNAADAQENGGNIDITASEVEGAAVIRVSDKGPGIDESVRARIFQPFFTTKEKGTGLGLALVHRIVTAHGGTVEVHNPPEGGSVFVLILPGERL